MEPKDPAEPKPDAAREHKVEWTGDALERVKDAPDFVRPGIYKLMVKRALERGKRIIDSSFLTEIRNESMMLASKRIKKLGFEELSLGAFDKAREKLRSARKKGVIDSIKTFLAERTRKNEEIVEKFTRYMEDPSPTMGWEPDALERIGRAPLFVREMAKKAVEDYARKNGYRMVTKECVDDVFRNLIPDSVKKSFGIGHDKESR